MSDANSQNQPRRILIIDDNEAIHGDFRKILNGSSASADLNTDEEVLFGTTAAPRPAVEFAIDTALQGREGFEKVAAAAKTGQPYHVAFVDMRMPPGWDGVETIRNLWQADPFLQVVICTAYSDYSWEQVVAELGTTDRLLILKKPFDELEVCQLATALAAKWFATSQANLKRVELESLVQARTAELQYAALTDRLTGLPNRELLHDRLSRLIQQSRRDPAHKFAFLFLDFDRFKVVNDSLGHQMGDRLLIAIAERLRQATRSADTVASCTASRLGGDEFAVLLDQLHEHHDAARVAQRLLERLAVPYDLGSRRVYITASIGITTNAVPYACPEEMLRDADTAMYQAKAAGRGRYVMFDQRMHAEAVRRLTLENELRAAVQEGQFLLEYQPIVSLAEDRPCGLEALVRWSHPTRGIVSPGEFIPLAEEIGLIEPLGNWVLEEACRQIAAWNSRNNRPPVSVNVNLSPKQLCAPDFAARVGQILARTGANASSLKLEITENAVMENSTAAIRTLNHLREMGIELYLDDFGTGHSALSSLHHFPISGLKIDRNFVKDIVRRRDFAAVVGAVLSLTRSLNMALVAEGVETAEQAELLRSMGCQWAQGFYFARPMPPREAEKFLQNQGNRDPLVVCSAA